MNYKYNFIDDKVIVSEQEHRSVLEANKKGQMIVALRGGDLIVNMALVKTVAKTEESIQLSSDEQLDRLRLETKNAEAPTSNLLPTGKYGGMKKAIEASDKECVNCKQIHFIPENKTLCLPCLMKTKV